MSIIRFSDASAPHVNWDRMPATPKAAAAVDNLTEALIASENRKRAPRRADQDRLRATLGSLALELYLAHHSDKDPALRISRAKGNYETKHRNRYNASRVTHVNACRAMDWLKDEGYLSMRLGYNQRYPEFGPNAMSGQQTRIWPTEKLVEFFEGQHGLTIRDVGFAPWLETIILRDESEAGYKADVDYTDTDETLRMRANLSTINEALAGFRLSLAKPDGSIKDLPQFRLRRIFSKGSFQRGGRFYRGPWIDLPTEERRCILIEGEETVELDYRSLHPRLIYGLEGLSADQGENAYAVSGWESPERRALVKKAFQQLINADGGYRLRRPKDVPPEAVGSGEWPRLIQALESKHANVSHWFRSGRGLELQRIDSDMAERVMLELLPKGVCCLPIHDSFIVPASAKEYLREAMDEAFDWAVSARNIDPPTGGRFNPS